MQTYTETRFDFFVVTDNLQRNVESVEVSQSITSDHKTVSLYLSTETNKQTNEEMGIGKLMIIFYLMLAI